MPGEPLTAGAPWRRLPPLPELPAPFWSGTAHVNGIEMWHALYGRGDPVLLIHGGTASAEVWGLVIPELARNRRVIVADSRGHGRSTRGDGPLRFDLITRDYLALLDHLRIDRADVVGTSDGGIIGIGMALHHRHRVRRVFAHAANVTPDGQDPRSATAPTFQEHARQGRALYERVSPTPERFDALTKELAALYEREPDWGDDALGTIATPVAIVHSEHDEDIARQHAAHIADAIPTAELIMLHGVSHFATTQDPVSFARAVLRFVDADRFPEDGCMHPVGATLDGSRT